MSASLKRLREYFDDPLLSSVGRAMALSPRATALVEPVRETLLSVEALFEVQPEFDAVRLRQAFHIAIADFLTPRVMPTFLAKLGVEAPQVHMHVERVTDATMRRLLEGDIALGYWPYDVSLFGTVNRAHELNCCRLRSSPWRCIAALNHPRISNTLSLDQYLALPHIVPRPGLGTDRMDHVWRQTFHADMNIVASTNSLLDLPAIVAKTELLATVPESMLELLTDVAPIRVMPVPMVLAPLKETVYWHRRHENDPAHRWLRNLFKDCALTSAGADLDTTSPRGHAMGTHPLVTY